MHAEFDLGRDEILKRFDAFEAEMRQADVALLAYSGHGLQIGGENFWFRSAPGSNRRTTSSSWSRYRA